MGITAAAAEVFGGRAAAEDPIGHGSVPEPGYTQIVYLKIENEGNVDFD